MRIAFVSYGFGEYCVAQANELAQRADVLLLMPEDVLDGCAIPVAPQVQCVPFSCPRLRQPLRQMQSVRRLLRKIHKFQPDVVHMQSGHLWFNMALPLLRRYPRVVTIHDPRHHPGDGLSRKTPQAVLNYGYRSADRAIVHSNYVRQEVVEYQRITAERIDVIPHVAIGGRDAEALPTCGQAPNVLFFGRIWEYKGLEYYIRAQPEVTRVVPDARFVIGGQGEDFARYERMMADAGRFEVHNDWISDALRTRLFRQASVVVLPYIEASQSGVIPVAYSFAKPVIVTDIGGLPEMVDHGRTGLLVPPRDAGALAKAIASLLQDPQRCESMGEAGREKLNRECSPAAVAELTLATYRRAIEAHNGGAVPRDCEDKKPSSPVLQEFVR